MTAPLLNQAPNSPPLGNPVPTNILNMMFPNSNGARWREEVGGTFTYKAGDSSETVNFSCNYNQVQPATALGYPLYPNNGKTSIANRGISRVLPVTHPVNSSLFCTAVTNGRGQKVTGWMYGSTNLLTTFLLATGASVSSVGPGVATIPISDFIAAYFPGNTAAAMYGINVGTPLIFTSISSPSNTETAIVSAITDTSFTVNLANSYGGGGPESGYIVSGLQTPTIQYDRAQATLSFSSLPYQVLPDILVNGTLTSYPLPGGQIVQTTVGEWQRFCEWEYLPNLSLIQKRAGSFHFTQGQGLPGTWPPGPPFSQATYVRSPISTLICHWRWVPHMAVWGINAGLIGTFNPLWQSLLGKVNMGFWPNQALACYNPSEMLLTAIKCTARESPVNPTILGLDYLGVSRCWDVAFHFSVTSPPRNSAFAWVPQENPLQGGHNVFPNPANDGFYYFATNNGLTTGNSLYRPGNFDDLFKGAE